MHSLRMDVKNMYSFWDDGISIEKITLENHLFVLTNDKGDKRWYYKFGIRENPVDFVSLISLAQFVSSVPTDDDGKCILPIAIDLNNRQFQDKMVYIFLETMIIHLINDLRWPITVLGDYVPENCSSGVCFSGLAYGNWPVALLFAKDFEQRVEEYNKKRISRYKYIRECEVETDITRCFGRYNGAENDTCFSSDIYSFFEKSAAMKTVDKLLVHKIVGAILEIKDNCTEHALAPYVYDIDIKDTTHGKASPLCGERYISINIMVWDFSMKTLGDKIKEKINIIESPSSSSEDITNQVGNKVKVFEKLKEAKQAHEKLFDESYTISEFYTLAAFQPGITGRTNPGSTGGAGLASVIDFLKKYTDNYKCRCLTGNTYIDFSKEFLNFSEDDWISFSDVEGNDFKNHKPSGKCVSRLRNRFPGTAFFFHLEINGGSYESNYSNFGV